MKNQKEDNFYSEMDQKNTRRSCCTCQTMVIFFSFILIFAIIFSIYFVKAIKQINLSGNSVQPSYEAKNTLIQKLKINEISNPEIQITITSEELTTLASEGLSGTGYLLKNIQILIDENSINIFGKLIKPLRSDVKITTIPTIKNDKIVIEVKNITAGKLKLPNILNSSIESSLNKLMDENFNSLYQNYEIKSLELKKDQMIINGIIKNKI